MTSSSNWTAARASFLRRLRVIVLLAATVCAVLCGTAAARAPYSSLVRAFGRMQTLAKHSSRPSTRALATDAARNLALAAFPELWSNAREVVAPSYGARVFTFTAAALNDIRRLESSSVTGLGFAVKLILQADRGVAQGATTDAQGARKPLLRAAVRQLAAGDRAAAAGDAVGAARHYGAAWNRAFRALTQLVSKAATTVPTAALNAAAANALGSKQIGLAGPVIQSNPQPLTLHGKPELLYIGAEGCPFCAVQRWGLIVALSRFGTFSNLHLMQSLTVERPEVRTFTFFGSRYSSRYVSFVPIEVSSNVPLGNGFAPLQRVTPAQANLFDTFDPPQQFPFVHVGGSFTSYYSTVRPQLLAGMTWTQITRSLRRPNTVAAQAVAGEAEVLTAELCNLTNNRPSAVCSSPVVAQYFNGLPDMDGRGGGCPAASPAATSARRRGLPPTAGIARCHV